MVTSRDRAVRRDRHGRGLRGRLLPADLPAARTRAEQFDDLVADALSRVHRRLGDRLADLAVAVDEVPPTGDEGTGTGEVALFRTEPATGDRSARLVVHRRPVESRARGVRSREDLVLDVVVEGVAEALDLPVELVDPDGADGEDGP